MKGPQISVIQGANQIAVEEQLKVGAEVLRFRDVRAEASQDRNRNGWEVRWADESIETGG